MKPLPFKYDVKSDNRLKPAFDHKEIEDDDCGLPEHPLFSNYSKYLWKRPIGKYTAVKARGKDGNK